MTPQELIAANPERACEIAYEAITGETVAIYKRVPALLTSLDDWRPLWEAMDLEFLNTQYWAQLELIKIRENLLRYSEPIHHLEAALRAIEVTCPDCEGRGWHEVCFDGITPEQEPCTCNAGKISAYELLEREGNS